jgi:hypothetical protein
VLRILCCALLVYDAWPTLFPSRACSSQLLPRNCEPPAREVRQLKGWANSCQASQAERRGNYIYIPASGLHEMIPFRLHYSSTTPIPRPSYEPITVSKTACLDKVLLTDGILLYIHLPAKTAASPNGLIASPERDPLTLPLLTTPNRPLLPPPWARTQ